MVGEYETDIFITTKLDGHNLNVPYTFFFDGSKVFIYQYALLKHTIEKKVDVKFDKFVIRILIGNEIGIIENYLRSSANLIICFEKTNYPSKFYYRKAQMWIGAHLSKVKVLGHIIYNNIVNRIFFSAFADNNEGVVFEGTSAFVLDENMLYSTSKVNDDINGGNQKNV